MARYTTHNPPPGYTLITHGNVTKRDFVWDCIEECWRHPIDEDFDLIGSNVIYYIKVARKTTSIKIDENQVWWDELGNKFGWTLLSWNDKIIATFSTRDSRITITQGQADDIRLAFGMPMH